MLASCCSPCLRRSGVGRAQRLCDGSRMGRARQELGGDKVNVYTATTALQDPHRIEAKPSLIARARSADLVVATGAELEVGWLPLVTAAGRQPEDAAGHARLLRGGAARDAARQAGAARPRRGRHPPGRRSAHPDRSAQHRARRRAARRADGAARSRQRRALPGAPHGVRRALERGRSRGGSSRRRR